ncbi:MAG: 2-oxoacid:acceptor oxidoreductase family protein [Firmicutes bacterium]|nr:2-oxoacid:acceptor oxidoreductase family protein [Bacillota bacterium]
MFDHVNIKVAGFGGQGVMMFGQLIAYSAAYEELFGLWFPSYGPETRGGTANCSVIVSKKQINSPVFQSANHLIAFNLPSLQKFHDKMKDGGLILYNSSLIKDQVTSDKAICIGIPINDIATDLGSIQVSNIVMMGAYLELTNLFVESTIEKVLIKYLGEKKAHMLDINMEALRKGREYVLEAGVTYA